MDSLGIYVSIPFCRSKCTYCNFASGVFPSSSQQHYVERLSDDVRGAKNRLTAAGLVVPSSVDTVYLGGGTPSLLSGAQLKMLFGAMRNSFDLDPAAEITVECAPGQLGDEFLEAAVEMGVNRLSFGVQSLVDREAAVSGRLHTREVALRDLERVKRAGIERTSVDLIAGLAHQNADSWRESLAVLEETGVSHCSVYMLEVDEDSRLGRELLAGGGRYHADAVPAEEFMADAWLEAAEAFERRGLAQYEISNFARPGRESRHNERYWLRRPYLGFGIDAHSMLRNAGGQAVRFATGEDLGAYLEGPADSEFQSLTKQQEIEETWFLGLRRSEGVSSAAAVAEFGPEAAFESVVADLVGQELLRWSEDRVRLTRRGQLLSNEVFARFLADDSESGQRDPRQFEVEVY